MKRRLSIAFTGFGLVAIASACGSCDGARTLADRQNGVDNLTVSSGNVAWSTGDWVARMPSSGGAVEVVGPRQRFTGGIAMDGRRIVWTGTSDGKLWMSEPGHPATVVCDGLASPGAVALAGQDAFVVGRDLVRVRLDTHEVTVLGPGGSQPSAIVVERDTLYWLEGGVSGQGSHLRAMPRAGGPIRELATDLELPHGMPADARELYVMNGEAIYAISKTSAARRVLARADFALATSLVLHDGWLYTTTGKSVVRVPTRSGAPEPVVTGDDISEVAVDDHTLFWGDNGAVRSRPLP